MPQFPCVVDSGQKEKKKKRKVCKKKILGKKKSETVTIEPGEATHTELVQFLNKKKRYNAVSKLFKNDI